MEDVAEAYHRHQASMGPSVASRPSTPLDRSVSQRSAYSAEPAAVDENAAVEPAVWKHAWRLLAISTTFSWGVNNFMYGVIAERGLPGGNLSAVFVVWLTQGAIGIGMAIPLIVRDGLWSRIQQWRLRLLCVGSGAANSMGSLALTLAIAANPASKGPICAVLPVQGVFVALLARGFYGERVTPCQVSGIVVAMGGVVMMTLAKVNAAGLEGFGYGLLCAVAFGLANFLLKCVTTARCDVQAANAIVYLTCGVFGVVSFVVTFATGRGLQGIDGKQLWLLPLAGVAGVLRVTGIYAMMFAFKTGGAGGVVVTIANTSSIVVLVLDLIFFKPDLNPIKLGGMAVVLSGIAVLALAPPSLIEATQAPPEVAKPAAVVVGVPLTPLTGNSASPL